MKNISLNFICWINIIPHSIGGVAVQRSSHDLSNGLSKETESHGVEQ